MPRRLAILFCVFTAWLVLIIVLGLISQRWTFHRDIGSLWVVSLRFSKIVIVEDSVLPGLVKQSRSGDVVFVQDAPTSISPLRWPLSQSPKVYPARGVNVGLWIIALPPWLGVTAIWFWQIRTRRRIAIGACPRCGYALAGLPAEAVCPECGGSVRMSKNDAA